MKLNMNILYKLSEWSGESIKKLEDVYTEVANIDRDILCRYTKQTDYGIPYITGSAHYYEYIRFSNIIERVGDCVFLLDINPNVPLFRNLRYDGDTKKGSNGFLIPADVLLDMLDFSHIKREGDYMWLQGNLPLVCKYIEIIGNAYEELVWLYYSAKKNTNRLR